MTENLTEIAVESVGDGEVRPRRRNRHTCRDCGQHVIHRRRLCEPCRRRSIALFWLLRP